MVPIFGVFLVVHIFENTYAEEDTFVNDFSTQIIVILWYSD
jgi:uncharacterized membrane protein